LRYAAIARHVIGASLVDPGHGHYSFGPERKLIPQHLTQALPFGPRLEASALHGVQNGPSACTRIGSERSLGCGVESAALSDVSEPKFVE
jgi:hypothetical protein